MDNPPRGLLDGIVAILLYPMQSPSAFLWYIHVLAVYFLVLPWFLQISSRWAPVGFLLFGLALQGYAWTPFLNLVAFVEYLPLFSAGILLGQHWLNAQERFLKPSAWPLWLIPFGAALVYSHVDSPLPKWLVGSLSVPFVLCASQAVSGRIQKRLTSFGHQTLAIYLMNTIFIGLTKACVLFVVPWRDHYFVIHFVALALAGAYLPIVTKQFVQKVRPAWAAYM